MKLGMRNRAGDVQGFNKSWEQVLLQGQTTRDSRMLAITHAGPEAASEAPLLLGSPGLDIAPGCIQPGQPVFNEALIETELRLQAEESEDSPRSKSCHEGRCQTAPEVQSSPCLPTFPTNLQGGIRGAK